MTNAAAGDPDVEALVYVAAFAPAHGDTVEALTGMNPGSGLADPHKRAGATTIEIRSSHVVMMSHPTQVADVIERAATAVG
jgi:hypothetical protein